MGTFYGVLRLGVGSALLGLFAFTSVCVSSASSAQAALPTLTAVVPVPVNVALGIFWGLFLIVVLARCRPMRNRIHRWRIAIVQWIDAV